MTIVIQSILVGIILCCMVMAIVSISRLSNGHDDNEPESLKRLRMELEEEKSPVSANSIFSYLLARRVSVGNSRKGPSSRRE